MPTVRLSVLVIEMSKDDVSCSFKKTALKIFCRRPCSRLPSRKAADEPVLDATDNDIRELADHVAAPIHSSRAVRFSEPISELHLFEPDSESLEHGHYLRRVSGRSDLGVDKNWFSRYGLFDSTVTATASADDEEILYIPARRTKNEILNAVLASPYTASNISTSDGDYDMEYMLYGSARLVNLRRLGASFPSQNSPRKQEYMPPGFASSLPDFDYFQRRAKQFMQSLCVIDLESTDRRIGFTSRDLIPKEPLASGECLYLEDYLDDQDWVIQSSVDEVSRRSYHLLLKHHFRMYGNNITMHEAHRQTATHSSRCMYAQVDITEIAEDTIFDLWAEDVWLKIAADEMEKLALRKTLSWKHLSLFQEPPLAKEELWEVVSRIRSFYELYLVLGPRSATGASYEVTYVSSSLLDLGGDDYLEDFTTVIREKQQISCLFRRGERFFFDTRRHLSQPRQIACCVPMFGPALSCWVCFMITGTLFERCAQRVRESGSGPG